jgi:hypothetical protein
MSLVSKFFNFASGHSSQSQDVDSTPAVLQAEKPESASVSVGVGVDIARETHSQFCAGVSNGIARPVSFSFSPDAADISYSFDALSLDHHREKPKSQAEHQSAINACVQQIADIVDESQTAIAKAQTKQVDDQKSEAPYESKRDARAIHVRDKTVQEAQLLANFVEKVVSRVTTDLSRMHSFEKNFAQLLDNDAVMLKCCKEIAALNLLPKERFIVIDHIARSLADILSKNSLVQVVQESGNYEEEDIELCLQYASTLTIINLIKSSPDLKRLTKDVRELAPNWLKAKAADLD